MQKSIYFQILEEPENDNSQFESKIYRELSPFEGIKKGIRKV
jgi:hypothetical protein